MKSFPTYKISCFIFSQSLSTKLVGLQMCELPYQKGNGDAEMRHGLLSKSEAADADERNKEIETIVSGIAEDQLTGIYIFL